MQHSTHAAPLLPLNSQRLPDQVRERMRWLHFSLRTVQTLLGHARISTTMISTPVLQAGRRAMRRPFDALAAR